MPLIGALIVPPGSGKYVSGWYHRDDVRLFVSRGIGTSILPVRLVCGPEVTVFDVAPGVVSGREQATTHDPRPR